jgi:predicted Zn-dependent protease
VVRGGIWRLQGTDSLGLAAALALPHAAARMRVTVINAVHLIVEEVDFNTPARLFTFNACRTAGQKVLVSKKNLRSKMPNHQPPNRHTAHERLLQSVSTRM